MSRPTDELLAAYVDGVSELSPDERRRVEARLADDATARADEAATRELLGALRELPRDEPDWSALERSIQAAVADEPMPRRRWTSWLRAKWLVPGVACAAAAAVIAIVASRPPAPPAPPIAHGSGSVTAPAPMPPPSPSPSNDAPVVDDTATALWLDGSDVELDDAALDAIEASDLARAPTDHVETDLGLLPMSDDWVDTIDDDSLGELEQWLDDEQRRQRRKRT